jgi:ribosome-binding factor A
MEQYSTRQNKISKLIQKEMAAIVTRINQLQYPGKLITVSEVRVTKDMGISRVYFSIYPSEFQKSILSELKNNMKSMRGELGRKLGKSLRIIPELEFYVDDTLDRLEQIDKLLHS